jgi:hypothetical protein
MHEKNADNIDLKSHKKFFLCLVLLSLLYSLIGGARLPNLWATSHWLFDYELGFIKRGLAGEVLSWFTGETVSYYTIAAISWLILFVAFTLFFIYLKPILSRQSGWLTILILFSPAMISFVHTVGLFDHIGLLIAVVCLYLPLNFVGVVFTTLLCCVGILVHEAFFLLWLPVIFFRLFFHVVAIEKNHFHLYVLTILGVFMTGLTFYVAGSILPAEQFEAVHQHIVDKAENFDPGIKGTTAIFVDADDGHDMITVLHNNDVLGPLSGRMILLILCTMFLLPTSLFFVFKALKNINAIETKSPFFKNLAQLGVIAASLSPLFLNFFAIDIWRFFCIAQLCSVLVFVITEKNWQSGGEDESNAQPEHQRIIIIALIMLGLTINVPLLDNDEIRRPPYIDSIEHWISVYSGKSKLISIPTPKGDDQQTFYYQYVRKTLDID